MCKIPSRTEAEDIDTTPERVAARRTADGVHVARVRVVRVALALAWLAGLVAITLTPGGGRMARILSVCLICGPRGSADALLNVILFLPLGLLIGLRRGPALALLVGVGLSAGVETWQLLLTGRYSNVGDVVWNGLGAGLGAAATPHLRDWLLDGSRPLGRVLAVALPATWLLAAGLLLSPIAGDRPYSVDHLASASALQGFTDWQAAGSLARSASTGEDPTVAGARLDLEPGGGWTLAARATRAPLSRELLPIVGAYDTKATPIRVLGADREDLVLWESTWAPVMHFDYASHHLYGALVDHQVGDTFTVSASSTGGDQVCLTAASRQSCGPRIAPARTWTLLRSHEHASEATKRRIDIAWMATLTLWIGLLGGSARSTLVTAGAFVALVAAAAWLFTPLSELGRAGLLGLTLGVGLGVASRPVARLFLDRSP